MELSLKSKTPVLMSMAPSHRRFDCKPHILADTESCQHPNLDSVKCPVATLTPSDTRGGGADPTGSLRSRAGLPHARRPPRKRGRRGPGGCLEHNPDSTPLGTLAGLALNVLAMPGSTDSATLVSAAAWTVPPTRDHFQAWSSYLEDKCELRRHGPESVPLLAAAEQPSLMGQWHSIVVMVTLTTPGAPLGPLWLSTVQQGSGPSRHLSWQCGHPVCQTSVSTG